MHKIRFVQFYSTKCLPFPTSLILTNKLSRQNNQVSLLCQHISRPRYPMEMHIVHIRDGCKNITGVKTPPLPFLDLTIEKFVFVLLFENHDLAYFYFLRRFFCIPP